jgi:hypothetical protein
MSQICCEIGAIGVMAPVSGCGETPLYAQPERPRNANVPDMFFRENIG